MAAVAYNAPSFVGLTEGKRRAALVGSPPFFAVEAGYFGGFGGGEAFVDFAPVDGVPPGGEVVGTLVLVFEVVGVLPDVVAEDGG